MAGSSSQSLHNKKQAGYQELHQVQSSSGCADLKIDYMYGIGIAILKCCRVAMVTKSFHNKELLFRFVYL
jgi:hypothetical protein